MTNDRRVRTLSSGGVGPGIAPGTGVLLPLVVDDARAGEIDVAPEIAMLDARRAPMPVLGTTHAYLYRARAEISPYYIYDQAAVVLGLVAAGQLARAGDLLEGLAAAQLPDGSWPFVVYPNGAPYWSEGDLRHAGAVAWVVMAFNAHHLATHTRTRRAVVAAALDYLDGQRHPDQGHRPVRFNPSDLPQTAWDERQVNSFEHNADALSAFAGHAQLLGHESHPGAIADLRGWLLARWNGVYFNPGTHLAHGDNERERYLDTQTWGVLALGGGEPLVRAGLHNECPVILDATGPLAAASALVGSPDLAWSVGQRPGGAFVWSEGTLGYIAALDEIERKTGRDPRCEGIGADELVASMEPLVGPGAPAAWSDTHPEYGEPPGTAALAWSLMVDAGFNPFRPWETR